MPSKITKLIKEWNWLFIAAVYLVSATAVIVTYQNSIAQTAKDVEEIKDQHLPERMVRQEQISSDVKDSLKEIKNTQSRIYDILTNKYR